VAAHFDAVLDSERHGFDTYDLMASTDTMEIGKAKTSQASDKEAEVGQSSLEEVSDAFWWSPREQRALEAALRANPPRAKDSLLRWQEISDAVGSKDVASCVRRYRLIAAAIRARLPPPLLRLQRDSLLSVLEYMDGRDLCMLAQTCKEMSEITHEDSLWLSKADAFPGQWGYSKSDRHGERPWKFCLRVRFGFYGSWHKLTEHRAGRFPYLHDLGRVEGGRFRLEQQHLPYRLKYGFIAELVQLETRDQGGLNHYVYKAVAELLISLSANSKSRMPPEMHLTVREIYKICYPGFGTAWGTLAEAPGVHAGGGSSTGAVKGRLARTSKKMQDEEMRRRLESEHEFLMLV
jgi:hypothetical protein